MRQSSRVAEQESKRHQADLQKQLEEERIASERREKIKAKYSLFYNQLSEVIESTAADYFDVPDVWKEETGDDIEYEPYRVLVQNKYKPPLSRATVSRNDENDVPTCNCSPRGGGCDSSCENRMLYMECAPGCIGATASDGHCSNSVIQRRNFPKVEVFKTSNHCGFGLRVCCEVQPNTILIEYLGEVITSAECNERMSNYDESDDFYFAGLKQGLILDAKRMGSVARFANHACDPTCELQLWSVLGEPRAVLVSKYKLLPGTEITYNYGYHDDGLDSINSDMKRQECKCGSIKCSGTIGGKVLEVEDPLHEWRLKAESILVSKRKYTVEFIGEHLAIYGDAMVKNKLYISASKSEGTRDMMLREELEKVAESTIKVQTELREVMEAQTHWESMYLLDTVSLQGLVDDFPKCIRSDDLSIAIELLKKSAGTQKRIDSLLGVTISTSASSAAVNTKLESTMPESMNISIVKSELDVDSKANVKEESVDTMQQLSSSISFSSSTTTATRPTLMHNPLHGVDFERLAVQWVDWVAVVKEVDSVLPIRIKRTEVLLKLFEEVNQWCKSNFLKLAKNWISENEEKIRTPTGVVQSYARLRKLYEDLDYDGTLIEDIWILECFFDDILSSHIMRSEELKLRQPSLHLPLIDMDESNVAVIAASDSNSNSNSVNNINNNSDRKKSNSNSNSSKKLMTTTSSDPVTLYCYCQLPEEHGEQAVMSQCNSCTNWFHPNCINSSQLSFSAVRQRDKWFLCPTCQFKEGISCNFCFAPASEWNCKQKKNSSSTFIDLTSYSSSSSSSSHSSESINVKKHRKESAIPSATAIEGFLSLESLNSCIEAGRLLRLVNNPVLLLLNLYDSYISNWRARADAVLNSEIAKYLIASTEKSEVDSTGTAVDWIFNQDIDAFSYISSRNSLNEGSCLSDSSEFSLYTSLCRYSIAELEPLLKACLPIYFELRLIKVRPTREVDLLRLLIWRICVQVFVTQKLMIMNRRNDTDSSTVIFATSMLIEESKSSKSSKSKISAASATKPSSDLHLLSDLEKSLSAGLSLGAQRNSSICIALFQVMDFIKSIFSECLSSKSLIYERNKILNLLDKVAKCETRFDLSGEYAIVKLKNFKFINDMKLESYSSQIGGGEEEIATNGAYTVSAVNNNADAMTMAITMTMVEGNVDSSVHVPPSSENMIGNYTSCSGSSDIILYCWCREKDDGSPMVCCDKCDVWFHYRCAGIRSQKHFDAVMQRSVVVLAKSVVTSTAPLKKSKTVKSNGDKRKETQFSSDYCKFYPSKSLQNKTSESSNEFSSIGSVVDVQSSNMSMIEGESDISPHTYGIGINRREGDDEVKIDPILAGHDIPRSESSELDIDASIEQHSVGPVDNLKTVDKSKVRFQCADCPCNYGSKGSLGLHRKLKHIGYDQTNVDANLGDQNSAIGLDENVANSLPKKRRRSSKGKSKEGVLEHEHDLTIITPDGVDTQMLDEECDKKSNIERESNAYATFEGKDNFDEVQLDETDSYICISCCEQAGLAYKFAWS